MDEKRNPSFQDSQTVQIQNMNSESEEKKKNVQPDPSECELIQDLMVLYAEDLLHESSRKRVETHLAQCSSCRQKLSEQQEPVSYETASQNLAREARLSFRRQSRKKAIVLLSAVLGFFCAFGSLMMQRTWLSLPDERISVEEKDGLLNLEADPGVNLKIYSSGPNPENDAEEVSIEAYTSWLNSLFGRKKAQVLSISSSVPVWFVSNDGKADLPLTEAAVGHRISLPRIGQRMVIMLGSLAGAALLIEAVVFKKMPGRTLIGWTGMFVLCLGAASFLVLGFSLTSYDLAYDSVQILLLGLGGFLAVYSFVKAGELMREQSSV